MRLLTCENLSSGKLSKIRHHFRKQSDLKFGENQKMPITEKFAPTFVFFNENKIQKDLDDF